MAYIAPTILDRVAIGDDKYTITKLDDGRYQLTPSPDSVIEPGTEINKALLQALVNAVAEHDTELDVLKSRGIFNIASGSYVGDGTGTLNYDIKSGPSAYNPSTTPRIIEFPFEPNVVLIIEKTSGELYVIRKGATLDTVYITIKLHNPSKQSNYLTYSTYNTNFAEISGNELQLIQKGAIGTNSTAFTTLVSFTFYSDSNRSNEITPKYNKAGYTYYYLAF